MFSGSIFFDVKSKAGGKKKKSIYVHGGSEERSERTVRPKISQVLMI